jgi:hypothetical protein
VPVSLFFCLLPFFFHLFNPAHDTWAYTVPSLADMPQGWPGVDTEAGLHPEHIYPQCESFSFFSSLISLTTFSVVYTIHQIPTRDALGELLYIDTPPNGNLCAEAIRTPAPSTATRGEEVLGVLAMTQGKLVVLHHADEWDSLNNELSTAGNFRGNGECAL